MMNALGSTQRTILKVMVCFLFFFKAINYACFRFILRCLKISLFSDCQSGLPSDHRNLKGQTGISSALTPPRYLVCLDSLKDESHSFGSLSACYFGSFGKSVPSRSLAVSSSLLKHIPSDEPCLDGNGGYVESYSGSGHSLYYYQSRNTTGVCSLLSVNFFDFSLSNLCGFAFFLSILCVYVVDFTAKYLTQA